jgi:rare lipoprotein A
MTYINKLLLIITAATLAACSSPDSGSRYSIANDVGPDKPISLEHIEDAHPIYEPFSRGGNKDYKLRGNAYQIEKQPDGFTQTGEASWYGKKFHGHLTSNGERYDMYSMSAAHKTLPIPSYVKVINKDNGKTAIVRVNDRGPFYDGRIIDLSYAAAYKLDIITTGTANVEIAYISTKPAPPKNSTSKSSSPSKSDAATPNLAANSLTIQVAASSHQERIRTLAQDIGQKLSVAAFVEPAGASYRLLLGPFTDSSQAENMLEKIKAEGYTQAFIRKSSR